MCVCVTFIAIVDGAITTVALPSIARQFQLTTAALDGVVVVYPVCLAMAIPASAWLVERFGAKRVLLTALGAFLVSSLLCGAAAGLGQLVASRAVQGLSAGVLFPAASSLLFSTFNSWEQVRISRYMIIPQQIAPAAAPMLGGLLVDHLSWRWVFYVNLPLGLPAVVFGALFLAGHRGHRPGRFDLTGLLLSAAALGGVMFGVCEGPNRGWSSPSVVTALVLGAVLLTAAIVFELRVAEPLLKLRLFADRLFRDTNLINLVGLVPILGAMYLGPLFLQQGQGRSALESGTSTFPEAFGVLLTVQIAGILYSRVGPRIIIGSRPGHGERGPAAPRHLRPGHRPVDLPRLHVPARHRHGRRLHADHGGLAGDPLPQGPGPGVHAQHGRTADRRRLRAGGGDHGPGPEHPHGSRGESAHHRLPARLLDPGRPRGGDRRLRLHHPRRPGPRRRAPHHRVGRDRSAATPA
jgi:MFS family permease